MNIKLKIVLGCLWCVKFDLFLMWWRDGVHITSLFWEIVGNMLWNYSETHTPVLWQQEAAFCKLNTCNLCFLWNCWELWDSQEHKGLPPWSVAVRAGWCEREVFCYCDELPMVAWMECCIQRLLLLSCWLCDWLLVLVRCCVILNVYTHLCSAEFSF